MATWGDFAHAMNGALGAPDVDETVLAWLTWMAGEQPPDSPNGAFNPLNIQAGDFPHVGVTPGGQYDFASFNDGVAQTAAFIRQGFYVAIVAAFQAGGPALAIVVAIQDSPWAEGHYGYGLPGLLNAVRSNEAMYLAGRIAGVGGPVSTPPPPPKPPPAVACVPPFTMP